MTRPGHPSSLRASVPLCLRAFVLLSLLLAACSSDPTRGYSFRPTHAAEVRSISVPVFENQTFSRGMEVALTDAIIKEIQRTTPWVVVQGSAQTTLSGSITETQLRNLSVATGTGLVGDQAVQATVDFVWRDSRTGRILVARQNFRASESFIPARAVGERIELGEQGVVQELARDIVAELRTNW